MVAKTSTSTEAGQVVKLLTRVVAGKTLAPERAPEQLPIAYEDEHFGVVVKPQGMPTMGKGIGVTAAHCVMFALSVSKLTGTPHFACV